VLLIFFSDYYIKIRKLKINKEHKKFLYFPAFSVLPKDLELVYSVHVKDESNYSLCI